MESTGRTNQLCKNYELMIGFFPFVVFLLIIKLLCRPMFVHALHDFQQCMKYLRFSCTFAFSHLVSIGLAHRMTCKTLSCLFAMSRVAFCQSLRCGGAPASGHEAPLTGYSSHLNNKTRTHTLESLKNHDVAGVQSSGLLNNQMLAV